jgi:hypothetical protein
LIPSFSPIFKGHKSGGLNPHLLDKKRLEGLWITDGYLPAPRQVVIITSQAGSVEWRFTQNKGEGLEAWTGRTWGCGSKWKTDVGPQMLVPSNY